MTQSQRKITGATNSLDTYLELVELTESPLIFHRWCFISAVSSLLGRNVYLPFGESKIYPNQYVTLIGPPGSRKSSAISIIGSLLAESGYLHFSGDRSSKEKFMMDWEFGFDKIAQGKEPEDEKKNGSISDVVGDIFGGDSRDKSRISEVTIKAGELEDFLGSGNSGFISTLTNLWDNLPYYTDRFKNSKSLYIPNPTVNLLGGATTTTFASIFSANIIGQGMLSRMLLVHGKGQRLKLTIPPPLPMELRATMIELFRTIRYDLRGEMHLEPPAYDAVDFIYNNFTELQDSRFLSYCSRRLTHLLKLCMILAASEMRVNITIDDVLLANTILAYTELSMPKALGEFGKSKNSEVTNIILDAISHSDATGGITMKELLTKVSQDVDSVHELGAIIHKLWDSDKIQKGERGKEVVFKPVKKVLHDLSGYTDFNLLWEHRLGSF